MSSGVLDNAQKFSMEESMRERIDHVSWYVKWVKHKMRWLKSWHWSEARAAEYLHQVLSRHPQVGVGANKIVQFLLGCCNCSMCRVGYHLCEDEDDDPLTLLRNNGGDDEGNDDHGEDEAAGSENNGDGPNEDGEESRTEDSDEEGEDIDSMASSTHDEENREESGYISPVQLIEHRSPPAEIHAEEAAQVVAQQEAGFVERLLGISTSPRSESSETNEEEDILKLKLNRIPSFIRRDLAVAKSLAQCLNALTDAGHPWKTVEGAHVFVHPHQYRKVMAANRDHLRPDNILVSASIEHLVAEVLQNTGIWARSREAINPVTQSAIQTATLTKESSTADERHYRLTIKRTFLCVVPEHQERATCSTGDARMNWVNPRRC